MEFSDFFFQATREQPFPYQNLLATSDVLPQLLHAPTGSGKTAAAVLSWLWRRRYADPEIRSATPRRLVYCLPMRTLVDQTASRVDEWLANLDLADRVGLHTLRGGAVDDSWERFPERDAVLVGTQDQLLSRALNRGYGMSRYRWPVHFGLVNNDSLWVLDETQLMGVGLSTSAQLEAFRKRYGTFGPTGTLWMSATLDPDRLATVDLRGTPLSGHGITEGDRQDERLASRLSASKRLHRADATFSRDVKAYARSMAAEVLDRHRANTMTLVIVNRVVRAQTIYLELAKAAPGIPLALIHSRFRPADRAQRQQEVLGGSWNGILVATQAVEAGVDISAAALFTELGEWSSLVQRFGRCNRMGEWSEGADVYWLDIPDDDRDAAPYDAAGLAEARALLSMCDDVGVDHLPATPGAAIRPTGPVVRSRDLLDLFDTQPDLAGCDIDVSPYIRATSDTDVQVYWRTWDDREPNFDDQPHEAELCNVPVHELRDLLKRTKETAYRWNGLTRAWERVERPVPGMMILLHGRAGGYDANIGWTTASRRPVERIVSMWTQPNDADTTDHLSIGVGRFITIDEHTSDVLSELKSIIQATFANELPAHELETAALWHDVGKAHPVFQQLLLEHLPSDDSQRMLGPYAKSPAGRGGTPSRPHFRHELASALALLAAGGGPLESYLVAAHHGKVRLAIRSRPTEPQPQDDRLVALGVKDGDVIESFGMGGLTVPRTELALGLMRLGNDGVSPSWFSRSLELLDEHGPFRLAFLESMLRVADWRASAAVAAEARQNG